MIDEKLLNEFGFHVTMSVMRQLSYLEKNGIGYTSPWRIITDANEFRVLVKGLLKRYPGCLYIPFARRDDSDDIAAFSGADLKDDRVIIVHDFASPGWEIDSRHDDVWDFLKRADDDGRGTAK
jgi:hypothetical protein